MNKKNITKSGSDRLTSTAENGITDGELELINRFTRRELKKDEVYAFSVVLCDNDIDRDGERFTVESLFELEKLFVGKTGIFDHMPVAENQTARIFKCEVESLSGVKTQTGDDYFRLRARAYIPRCAKNEELILAIDSGIIKEVSVSCAAESAVCSVCGEPVDLCGHIKGNVYGAKLCCGELIGVTDAYEWSFVAVPSQKNAGVIKNYKGFGKEINVEEILKNIKAHGQFSISAAECEKLDNYIEKLKRTAADGVYYRERLTEEMLRLSAMVQPEISRETMTSVAKGMTVEQLNEFKNAFQKGAERKIPIAPQLYVDRTKADDSSNGQFRI